MIRPIARSPPRHKPYLITAIWAYSEHVGVKRQAPGSSGEIHRLYSTNKPIAARLRTLGAVSGSAA